MGLRNAGNSSELQKELDTVRRDLHRLRGDFGDVVHAISSRGRRSVDQVRDGVNDEIDELNKRYAVARKYGRKQWCEARGHVEKHPVASGIGAGVVGLLIAAVAGLLIWSSYEESNKNKRPF